MSIDNYVNGMSEGSQRRGSVKDKVYKRPVSILVVIYAQDTKRVLMLQRRDDPDFWQSVTGSVESWFCLALPHERQIVFTEHLAYKWLDAPAAAALTKSWSNRQAIEQFVINAA